MRKKTWARNGRLWTPKEDALGIRMLRESPKDVADVAKTLGRPLSSVYQRNRNFWKVPVSQRRHWVNVGLFDSWSPIMSYMVGVIASDGNLSRKNWKISIGQSHDRGREWLEGLKKIVGGRIEGSYSGTQDYQLVLQHKGLWLRFRELGLTPAKSRTLLIPSVPIKYFDHFMRGLFDGDGSVCDTRDEDGKCPQVQAKISSSSKKAVDELSRRMVLLGMEPLVTESKDRDFDLCWTSRGGLRFLLWLYKRKEGTPFLRWKYETFRGMFEEWKIEATRRPSDFCSHGGYPKKLVTASA